MSTSANRKGVTPASRVVRKTGSTEARPLPQLLESSCCLHWQRETHAHGSKARGLRRRCAKRGRREKKARVGCAWLRRDH